MTAIADRKPSIKKSKKKRIRWAFAILLMASSAYCILRVYVIGSVVGDWIGLPQYAAQIPVLEREGTWFEITAIVLPFVAALLLVPAIFQRSKPAGSGGSPISYATQSTSERWSTRLIEYLLCLGASLVGIIGFLWVLFLISSVL